MTLVSSSSSIDTSRRHARTVTLSPSTTSLLLPLPGQAPTFPVPAHYRWLRLLGPDQPRINQPHSNPSQPQTAMNFFKTKPRTPPDLVRSLKENLPKLDSAAPGGDVRRKVRAHVIIMRQLIDLHSRPTRRSRNPYSRSRRCCTAMVRPVSSLSDIAPYRPLVCIRNTRHPRPARTRDILVVAPPTSHYRPPPS